MSHLFAPSHRWNQRYPEATAVPQPAAVSSPAVQRPPVDPPLPSAYAEPKRIKRIELGASLAPAAKAAAPTTWRTIAYEDEIVAVFTRPAPQGELPSHTFQRKEHELGALFAQLNELDSFELGRRLSVNAPTDPIASRFARLTVDRRDRLIAFVRDARRRAALAKAKRR